MSFLRQELDRSAINKPPLNLNDTLSVWFVTDNKAGHLTQLRGLEAALERRCELNSNWLSVESGWGDAWKRWRDDEWLAPDWLIGAGRRTHLPILLLRWWFKCRSLVLSKPSLPLVCFDLLALPRHDGVRASDKLLLTEGALNPVLPSASPDPSVGLMLIGGPSRHYDWDSGSMIEQITKVAACHDGVQWMLSTSRRTPVDFLSQLAALNLPNIELIAVDNTGPGWVAGQLQHCTMVWVSEDSVSMVYESLSAGAQVGLFEVPRLRSGRVTSGIDSLAERRQLTRYQDYLVQGYCNNEQSQPLQEAARVAGWILENMAKGAV